MPIIIQFITFYTPGLEKLFPDRWINYFINWIKKITFVTVIKKIARFYEKIDEFLLMKQVWNLHLKKWHAQFAMVPVKALPGSLLQGVPRNMTVGE